jgi:hypothetical protein
MPKEGSVRGEIEIQTWPKAKDWARPETETEPGIELKTRSQISYLKVMAFRSKCDAIG